MSASRSLLSVLALLLFLAAPAPAHPQQVVPDDEWCREGSGESGSDRYCEVREFTLEHRNLVRVDAEPNGGIQVEAWDRDEIFLRARVEAWTRSGDPREIVDAVSVETGGTIAADGPDRRSREGWSVSFRLQVPRNVSLTLESTNGGIRIRGIHGEIQFETLNGGISLEDVGGDVRGRTTNGGVTVRLSGDRFQGEGLDVETTNGGVTLYLPERYQANLETGTVNGSFQTDFPITISGRLRTHRITTQLNGGGPTLRVRTTNGGVRIRSG